MERDYPNEISGVCPLGREAWLPLYRVKSQATYKEIGSLDRVITSLGGRNLVNLACKEGRPVPASVHIPVWLSAWSRPYVTAWHDLMQKCWWCQHCWHNGGLSIVLCDVSLLWPLSSSPGGVVVIVQGLVATPGHPRVVGRLC